MNRRNIKNVRKTEHTPKKKQYNRNIRQVQRNEDDIEEEYIERRLKGRRRRMRLKYRIRMGAALFIIAAVAAVAIMLTPLFNIKSIEISGNRRVSSEEILQLTSGFEGENIFSVSAGQVRDALSGISLIDEVSVSKKIIPPTLEIEISESAPAGYLSVGGTNVIVNNELKVVEDSGEVSSLPQIRGVEVKSASLGKYLRLTESEKEDALKIFVRIFERTSMTENIDYIDLSNTAEYSFSYADKITVSCGSALELERKLRMFEETIKELDETAHGTVDLSTPGEAIYEPYE